VGFFLQADAYCEAQTLQPATLGLSNPHFVFRMEPKQQGSANSFQEKSTAANLPSRCWIKASALGIKEMTRVLGLSFKHLVSTLM